MHYYIDGYNMLFRSNQSFKELQKEREFLLEELNQKASLLNLNISIIFDAAYQLGGRSRSHFDALEIIYTAHGETADQYLVEMTRYLANPRQIIVVTSDKILASHLRHNSIKIESIHYFNQWLNRSYAKRLKTPKEPKIIPVPLLPKKIDKVVTPPVEQAISAKVSSESDFEYYQRIFEEKYVDLQQLEQVKKRPVKQTRQPKVKKDPFFSPQTFKNEATEVERWLKAFERDIE